MKLETFTAGHWQQRYQYKSFEPVLVNHEWIWEDPAINALLEQANRALGELNAFSLQEFHGRNQVVHLKYQERLRPVGIDFLDILTGGRMQSDIRHNTIYRQGNHGIIFHRKDIKTQ